MYPLVQEGGRFAESLKWRSSRSEFERVRDLRSKLAHTTTGGTAHACGGHSTRSSCAAATTPRATTVWKLKDARNAANMSAQQRNSSPVGRRLLSGPFRLSNGCQGMEFHSTNSQGATPRESSASRQSLAVARRSRAQRDLACWCVTA